MVSKRVSILGRPPDNWYSGSIFGNPIKIAIPEEERQERNGLVVVSKNEKNACVNNPQPCACGCYLEVWWIYVKVIKIRLCSHLMLEHSTQYSMWTHHFFWVLTPDFGYIACTRAQGLHLELGGYLEYPVSERNTIFYGCPGTSARCSGVSTSHVIFVANWGVPLREVTNNGTTL